MTGPEQPLFKIDTFVLPGQHIREYARATARRRDVLQLEVKRYTPLLGTATSPETSSSSSSSSSHSQAVKRDGDDDDGDGDDDDGAVTLIGAHANGFPKELYEPFWEEIYRRLQRAGQTLRAIWMADVASQGASGIINEWKLGNDPSGLDHSRDLLYIINHFRYEMPEPIIGIGHSMGACHLAQLSLMHPRLLHSIIMIEPIIGAYSRTATPSDQPTPSSPPPPSVLTTFRRDLWPSRAEAERSFRKSKFYQTWRPDVFDRWLRYGLRETPTAIYPSASSPPRGKEQKGIPSPPPPPSGAVTLATTKHQEAFMYLRPIYDDNGDDAVRFDPLDADGGRRILITNRARVPDLDPEIQFPDLSATRSGEGGGRGEKTTNRQDMRKTPSFYRPEAVTVFRNLPHLRPSVLYVFGADSASSSPRDCEAKMRVTGTGVGGSGGRQAGRVRQIRVSRGGHLMPMEKGKVEEVADHCAEWVVGEVKRFREEEEELELTYRRDWERSGGIGVREKSTMDSRWLDRMSLEDGADMFRRNRDAVKMKTKI